MLLRKISQIVFLTIFLLLFFSTKYTGVDELPLKVAIFLDLDPLLSFALFLSERDLSALFSISMIILFITFILGRVFCGWVCPFGTIHDVTSRFMIRRNKEGNKRYRWKYYLLIIFFICSVFSLNLVGILDPLSLLIRSLSVSISPLIDYFTHFTADAFYSTNIKLITAASEFFYDIMKRFILNFDQQFFRHSGFILLVFITLLLLNGITNRFFCKNLCPLGAFLGCFARYGLLKRTLSESCNSCGECLGNCKMARKNEEEWMRSECLVCMRCKDDCPTSSIQFTFGLPKKEDRGIDLKRRRIITSGLYGALLMGGVRMNLEDKWLSARAIRPPGSVKEPEFIKRCVKCGECMKVCLTNVLHPAFLEKSIEGLWTPILDFSTSYCEYFCTLCTQVCPTGAIEKLETPEKIKKVIGLAYIDPGRCIPYRETANCIVCEEFCPTSPKAIYFEKVTKKTINGTEKEVLLPKVDYSKCIGCGICEFKCPVAGRKAIYVLPPQEGFY